MASVDKEVENLIETICKLPPKDLKEVRRRIDKQLEDAHPLRDPFNELEDKEFWDSELDKEIITEADDTITREDVLKATASIKGSMATDISAERDER